MRQLVVFCLVACILAAALTEAKPTGRKREGRKSHKGSGERRGRQSGPAVFCRDDAVCPEGTVCKSWDIEGLSIVYNGAEVTIRSCRPENETMEARPESLESESSEEDKVRLPRPVMSLLRPACSVDGKMKECCENCTVGPVEITFGNATLEVFYCGSGDFDVVDTLNADECKRGKKGSSESGESDESSGFAESSEEAALAQSERPLRPFSRPRATRMRMRMRNGRSAEKKRKEGRKQHHRRPAPVFCKDDAVCPEGTVCKSWDIEGLSIVYNGVEVTIRSCRPENETMEARPERLESESSEEDKVRLPRPVMSLLRPACSVDGKMKECCENCTVGPVEITFGNATLEVFYCGSGDFDAVDTLNADDCKRGKKGSSESDKSDESSGSAESSEGAALAQSERPSRPFSRSGATRGRGRNGRSAERKRKGGRKQHHRRPVPVFCTDDAVCPEGTVCKSWDIEGLSIVYNGAEVTIRSCRPENETMVARPEKLESESSEEDKVRLPRPVMSLLRPACSVDGKMKECCENCTVGPVEVTFGNATLEVFYCGSGDFDAVDTLNADECKRGKKSSSESDESDESEESSGSSEETVRGRDAR